MKITKNRLKQIIKEELRKILEGDEIPFPTGRVSAPTYEGEGEVINYPDPLKKFKDDFYNALSGSLPDVKTGWDEVRDNLDLIFSEEDTEEQRQEKRNEIFKMARKRPDFEGSYLKRVVNVINDPEARRKLATKKTQE